jgi:hypothetical protein
MIKATRRRVLVCMLGAWTIVATVAATAFAGANTLQLSVPQVTKDVDYTITVSGTASGNKHLYLFIDSKKCGSNPRVEFSRTNRRTGTAYGYYWKTVSGGFSKSAGFRTTRRVTDHACAYLARTSAKKNSKRAYRVR